jgi:hypothetical protein
MGKIIGWSLLGIVFIWGVAAAAFGVEVLTAGIVGRGKAHIEIQSAPSRISGYNHFFDLCASVQNAESGIDQQAKTLTTASNETDKARIQINIDALQMTRANGIHQYNADASKDYTVGQFRDSTLPYHLDDTAYKAGGEHTQCGN